MTSLEKSIYLAAKAVVNHFETLGSITEEEMPPIESYEEREAIHNEPSSTSNGVPVCHRHGKAMRQGQYGYYCTSRETDPRFSNKNGYCNAKAK